MNDLGRFICLRNQILGFEALGFHSERVFLKMECFSVNLSTSIDLNRHSFGGGGWQGKPAYRRARVKNHDQPVSNLVFAMQQSITTWSTSICDMMPHIAASTSNMVKKSISGAAPMARGSL